MAPTHPTDRRVLTQLAALATALGLVLLALMDTGHRLPPPPLTSSWEGAAGTWSRWLAQVGPAGALMSGVRLVGLASTGYLLLVVTIEVLGRAADLPHLLSFGHRVSTPLTRRLVGGIAGFSLAASLTALSVGAPLPASADTIAMQAPAGAAAAIDDPTSSRAIDSDAGVPVMRAIDTGGDDVPVMRALDRDVAATTSAGPSSTTTTLDAGTPTAASSAATDPTPSTVARPDPSAVAPVPHPGPASSPPATAVDRWVIQRGDHLWGVARRTLAGTWPRPPTDAEVARYLDRLIEANAATLVVPGDADLVLVGQVFALPPVPAA